MHWHAGPGGMRLDEHDIELRKVNPRVYGKLFEFVRPHSRRLAGGALLMVLTALTALVGPYLVKVAVDTFIAERNTNALNWVAVAFFAAALINFVTSFGQTYVVSQVGQSVILDLRDQMFRHLQRLSFRFYDSMATGRIMSRLMNDVDAINQLVSSGLVTVFADSLILIAIAVTMLNMNWQLALVSFITIPVLLGVLQYFKHRMRKAFMAMRRKAADLNANLAESISGVRVTQSFHREDQNKEQFNQINAQNRAANLEAASVLAMFFPSIEVVAAFGVTLVLWFGGTLMRGGNPDITVGQIFAFILYLNRFFQPIRDLSQVWNVFQSAVVSTERVVELLDQQPDIVDRPDAYNLPRVRGQVVFKDVVFGYKPDQTVLKGINLRAEPGQTVALVGPTGAGKSSVINLLARFYDPQGGEILVDEHNLSSVSQHSWRSQLGVVLQDTFLFTGTIRDNIRYGRPLASDADVEAVARAVGADDFISRLTQGYETEVRERGNKLSVGQRQLIAFARALCANPALLILDEATSNIDTYSEQAIQEALQTLVRGRTSFVIAHRLSTIRNADRIYFIDDGVVVEEGTHDELLDLGGRYSDLYLGQFKVLGDQAAQPSVIH